MPDLENLLAELFCGEDERAESAVSTLAGGGQAAADALSRRLNDQNPDTRWWAVRALAAIKDVKVSEFLRAALQDEDASVRQCAALALREHPDPEATADLVRLLGDDDRMLARLAADALVAIGKPAMGGLIETLEKGAQAARLEAVRALAAIGDHESISALFKLLDEDSALMEYWASEGLEKMGVGMVFFNPG